MKINGKITILVGELGTTIELYDSDASTTFAKVVLTPEQLSSALSRLAYTECDIEVFGLEKLGKRMEHKKFDFEVPKDIDKKELAKLSQELIDKENGGWISDGYFSSQDSFFTRDDKRYARCIVRRWLDIEPDKH